MKSRNLKIVLSIVVTLLMFAAYTTIKASSNPTVFIDVFPKEFDNLSSDITFNVTEEGDGGFQYVELPDGKISYTKDNIYLVQENGTYIFTVVDTNNNRFEFEAVVDIIDKEQPTIKFLNVTEDTTYNEITPIVSVSDTGVSGLEKYIINLNGSTYTEGTPVSKSGEYNLEVQAFDNAGNSTISNVHFIINEKPTASLQFSKSSVNRSEVAGFSITTDDIDINDKVSVSVNAGKHPGDTSFNEGLSENSYQLKGTQDIIFETKTLPENGFVWNDSTKQYEQTVYIEAIISDTFGNAVKINGELLVYNDAPTFSTIPDLSITRQEEYELHFDEFFKDMNTDTLYYSVTVDDSTVVTKVDKSGSVVFKGSQVGETDVTITADDKNAGVVNASFKISVTNKPPVLLQTFDDIQGYITDSTVLNFGGYFREDDVEDTLSYTIKSSDESIAKTSVSGEAAIIEHLKPGTVTITVSAKDSLDEMVETQFKLTVSNEEPVVTVNASSNKMYFNKTSKIVVNGSIRDKESQSIVIKATLGGVEKSTTVTNGNDKWSLEWSASEIKDGIYNVIKFEINDNGLNTSQDVNVDFVIDKVSPSKPTYKKSVEAGGTVIRVSTEELDGRIEWQFGNEGWSAYSSRIQVGKVGTYSLVAFDKSGNLSEVVKVVITNEDLNKPNTTTPPGGNESKTPSSEEAKDKNKNGNNQSNSQNNNGNNNDSNHIDNNQGSPIDANPEKGANNNDKKAGETGSGTRTGNNNQDVFDLIPDHPANSVKPPSINGDEKPLTLEERIAVVIGNDTKVKNAEKQWENIYIENIKYILSDKELSQLQSNLPQIDEIVALTNKIENFRHKKTTKALYDLHQFLKENVHLWKYEPLIRTTLNIENRALKSVVPYDSEFLSLYQPKIGERKTIDISSDLPDSSQVGEKVHGVFYVNNPDRLINKPELSAYIKKDDSNQMGYIGNVFEWVKVSEEHLDQNKGKTELNLIFDEPGIYIVKVQLYDKATNQVLAKEEKIKIEGEGNDSINTETIENEPIASPNTDTDTNNAEESSEKGPIDKNRMILIVAGFSSLSLIGLIARRKLF